MGNINIGGRPQDQDFQTFFLVCACVAKLANNNNKKVDPGTADDTHQIITTTHHSGIRGCVCGAIVGHNHDPSK